MDQCDVVILMPVYRDWPSASAVCQALDEQLAPMRIQVRVLLVDDGSPDGLAGWRPFPKRAISDIRVLRLRANVGHQRAICCGLCHIYDEMPADWVLVMDSDGEDRPEDAARMIRRALDGPRVATLAARRKRMEGLKFRVGYFTYRSIHRLLTGYPVKAGNFSILPNSLLGRLVVMPELWNHYAGAVFRSKVPFELVPFDRGKRFAGRSHMNLPSLMAHGLAGIATFQEIVATRILLGTFLGTVFLMVLLGLVLAIRLWTKLAVPGWATYTAGVIVLLCLQLVAISFNLVFVLISNRSRVDFLPIRDYRIFVAAVERLDQERAAQR